jgi:hypothetical protein
MTVEVDAQVLVRPDPLLGNSGRLGAPGTKVAAEEMAIASARRPILARVPAPPVPEPTDPVEEWAFRVRGAFRID